MLLRRLSATGIAVLALSVSTAPLAAPPVAIAKPCDGAKGKSVGKSNPKHPAKKGKGKAGKCGR